MIFNPQIIHDTLFVNLVPHEASPWPDILKTFLSVLAGGVVSGLITYWTLMRQSQNQLKLEEAKIEKQHKQQLIFELATKRLEACITLIELLSPAFITTSEAFTIDSPRYPRVFSDIKELLAFKNSLFDFHIKKGPILGPAIFDAGTKFLAQLQTIMIPCVAVDDVPTINASLILAGKANQDAFYKSAFQYQETIRTSMSEFGLDTGFLSLLVPSRE